MSNYYGIDVGGTTVKLGYFEDGTLVSSQEIPTDKSNNGENILPAIAAAMTSPAAGACLGLPGAVLPDYTVNRCVNLGWGVCRPGDELTALTGIPCCVVNDANAAALGEQWQGGGAGFSDVLLVTLGTGVGAGVILGGRLVTGAHGSAGELGHICVEPDETDTCGCGNHGCLEQFCSATGLVRLAEKAGMTDVGAKKIFDLAKQGNDTAVAVTNRFCDLLGRGIAAACTVIDPDVVVLGGGVSRAGEFLRLQVETAFQKYAFHACRGTEIRLATLGGSAGMYGCARRAMQEDRKAYT